jgi:hypothetical protein
VYVRQLQPSTGSVAYRPEPNFRYSSDETGSNFTTSNKPEFHLQANFMYLLCPQQLDCFASNGRMTDEVSGIRKKTILPNRSTVPAFVSRNSLKRREIDPSATRIQFTKVIVIHFGSQNNSVDKAAGYELDDLEVRV